MKIETELKILKFLGINIEKHEQVPILWIKKKNVKIFTFVKNIWYIYISRGGRRFKKVKLADTKNHYLGEFVFSRRYPRHLLWKNN